MNEYVLSSIIAYFIGNFSTSYLIGKYTANIDIRNHGSGNAGTTNILRTLGKKAALYTFLGDALKGSLAVFVGFKLGGMNAALLSALFVVLGHDWPVLLKFRGGKGVATTLGSMIAVYPFQAIICILLAILAIYKTRYVSLGSIVGILAFPFFMFFKGTNQFILSLSLLFLIVFTHRENIKRLINGTERKIGQKAEIR